MPRSTTWATRDAGLRATAFLARGGLSVEHAGVLPGVALARFVASVRAGGAAAQWAGRPGVVVALGLLPFGVARSALRHASPVPALVAVGLLAGLPAGPWPALRRGS